jgi:poly(3-hydroxybutyrate) depolymerase
MGSSRTLGILLAALLLTLPAPAARDKDKDKDKVGRQTLTIDNQLRKYFCLIPNAAPDPLPVVVLLHGSGNTGQQMTAAWSDLASRERFIIAAPNSLRSEIWDSDSDGPAFLHAVVAAIAARHPIDPHRVYLFGHSGAAGFALALALIDSDYFAAVGAHAAALAPENAALFPYAHRKMPIALWVGAEDNRVSADQVHATRDAFAAHGFTVRVTVIPFAGHAFEGSAADKVTRAAWDFFQPLHLP